jgi:hypothetical protein
MASKRSPVRARLAPLRRRSVEEFDVDAVGESGRISGLGPKRRKASFRALRDLVGHGSRPSPELPLMLSWLDHAHTTAEERRLEALFGRVRRLFEALRSRG